MARNASAAGDRFMREVTRRDLDLLIEIAYSEPRRTREMLEAAFSLGLSQRARAPLGTTSSKRLAARLRRKAKVVQEFDGRSALLEMATELETGRKKGPMSSSASKAARGQP